MTDGPGVWLEELTWPEAQARLEAGAVVLVPIGALAKEHGHHLPLNTDWLLARELAGRVAATLPVVVAPIVGFGYYPAFAGYPGSQHLRAETFMALVTDILDRLIDQGGRHLAILNTGVSTEAPLQLAVRAIGERRGVRVATADFRALGRTTRHLLRQKAGGHADEQETSMLLAIDATAVRLDRAVEDYGHAGERPAGPFRFPAVLSGDPANPDWSRTGAFGDPRLATAEKGAAILAGMAAELVEGLKAAFPEAFGG